MTISAQRQRQLSLYAALIPDAEQVVEIFGDESYPDSYLNELYGGLTPEALGHRLIGAVKTASGERVLAFCTATYKFEESASDILPQAVELYLKKNANITWTGRGLALSGLCRKRLNGSAVDGSDFFTKYLQLALTTDEDIFGPLFGREQERHLRAALRTSSYLFKAQ